MGRPSAEDPLGLRPDPTSISDMLEAVVDERIKKHLVGRTTQAFTGFSDLQLVQELIARGWAVFRPQTKDPQ